LLIWESNPFTCTKPKRYKGVSGENSSFLLFHHSQFSTRKLLFLLFCKFLWKHKYICSLLWWNHLFQLTVTTLTMNYYSPILCQFLFLFHKKSHTFPEEGLISFHLNFWSWAQVARTYNPSYSGSRDQERFRHQSQANSLWAPTWKKTSKNPKRAG
jgi:hypothetical protein